MPLPMIHLLTAKYAAERAGLPSSGRYLLGNLAPDAVHMRSAGAREGKIRSHFRENGFVESAGQARRVLRESDGDGFIIGYAAHILVDYIWAAGPLKHVRTVLRDREDWKKAYYQDCDLIDRWLYIQGENRRQWNAVMVAQPSGFADLVTATEVDEWRKDRYDALRYADDTGNQPQILTVTEVTEFMDRAADDLAAELIRSGAVELAILRARG